MANLQLSNNLYKYRKSYGYTQRKLSQCLNISRQAYSNYETGRRYPDLDILIRLAEFYHITIDQLVHQPFSARNSMVKERSTPYVTATDSAQRNFLYLTEEELRLIMNYRETTDTKRELVRQLLL